MQITSNYSAGAVSYTPAASQASRTPVKTFDEVLAAPPDTGVGGSFSALTDDDKRVLAAATGVTLNANGSVATNTTGKLPDWGMFLQVAQDRSSGSLQGTMTSTYVQGLITNSQPNNRMLPDLNKALDFLLQREAAAAETPIDLSV